MDKEKQIEEMTSDIIKTFSTEYIYAQSEVMKNISDITVLVSSLISKGYRKIKDNEVVISKEEYEGLINQNKGLKEENHTLWLENNDLEAQVELKSKETAREILSKFKKGIKELAIDKLVFPTLELALLEEIAKQYGVEIGERK